MRARVSGAAPAIALGMDAATQMAVFQVVLTSLTMKTRIEMSDVPDHEGKVVVGWTDLPGTEPGALVFARDVGIAQTRYMAVGGGPFALVDYGYHTFLDGARVPTFDLIHDDPMHPWPMVVARDATIDGRTLLARYYERQHVAAEAEAQDSIERAIAVRAREVGDAHGVQLVPDVRWASFAAAHRIRHAKQTIAVLDAIEAMCRDADYRDALRAFDRLVVDWRANADPFALGNAALLVTFSDSTFNPRQTAAAWLAEHV